MCWTVYSMLPLGLQTRIYKRYVKPGTPILWFTPAVNLQPRRQHAMELSSLSDKRILPALWSSERGHLVFRYTLTLRYICCLQIYPEHGGRRFQRHVGCYLRRLFYILEGTKLHGNTHQMTGQSTYLAAPNYTATPSENKLVYASDRSKLHGNVKWQASLRTWRHQTTWYNTPHDRPVYVPDDTKLHGISHQMTGQSTYLTIPKYTVSHARQQARPRSLRRACGGIGEKKLCSITRSPFRYCKQPLSKTFLTEMWTRIVCE